MSKTMMASNFIYFWEERGDLERCAGFDEYIDRFPQLKIAWVQYKLAERLVSFEVDALKALCDPDY